MGGALSISTESWQVANKILAGNKEKSINSSHYKNSTCEILYTDDKPLKLIAKDPPYSRYTFSSSAILGIHRVSGTHDIIIDTDKTIYIISSECDILNKPKKSADEIDSILKELESFSTGYTTIYNKS